MNKKKLLLVVGLIMLLVFGIVIFVFLTPKDEWKKVNIENCSYYDDTEIQLDLDGDNTKENIIINGKYITINNKDYVFSYGEDDSLEINIGKSKNSFKKEVNKIEFFDINGDGILEILHINYSGMISPASRHHTIYNFKENKLKKICEFSIIGNMPKEVYVKGNTFKFEYWPHESPENYREEIVCDLNV